MNFNVLSENMKTKDALEDWQLSISVFTSIIATVLAGVYYLSRLGFQDQSTLIVEILSVSYLVLLIPVALRSQIDKKNLITQKSWWLSDAFLTLGTLILVILMGYSKAYYLLPLIIGSGLALFMFYLISFRGRSAVNDKKSSIVIVSALSLWLASKVWGSGYLNPLFIENIVSGKAHIDTLFHAAISNMIATYGIPSTGLDGIPYLKYHIGSHWVFAQISKLLNMEPLVFYQAGYPIIFIPIVIKSILMFVMELKKSYGSHQGWDDDRSRQTWMVLLIAFVGFLPTWMFDQAAVWNIIIGSESYCLSIVLFFSICSLTLKAYQEWVADKSRFSGTSVIFFCFIMPALLGILGFMKVSVMFLALVVLIYLYIRLHCYRYIVGNLSIVLVLSIFVFVYTLITPTSIPSEVKVFAFIKDYVIRDSTGIKMLFRILMFFVLHFLWSWLFIYSWLRHEKVRTIRELFVMLYTGRAIEVEIILLLCLVGITPGLILDIGGGSAAYFSDLQYWVSVAFVMANIDKMHIAIISSQWWKVHDARFVKIIKNCVIIGLIMTSINMITAFGMLVSGNLTQRHQLMYGTESKLKDTWGKILIVSQLQGFTAGADMLGRELVLLRDKPWYVLKARKDYKLIEELRSLGPFSTEEKKTMVLFIPQTNTLYWNMISRSVAVPFLAPALSGLAMIDGLPQPGPEFKFYGYNSYQQRLIPQTPSDVQKEIVYKRALEKGFEKVIFLETTEFSNN